MIILNTKFTSTIVTNSRANFPANISNIVTKDEHKIYNKDSCLYLSPYNWPLSLKNMSYYLSENFLELEMLSQKDIGPFTICKIEK